MSENQIIYQIRQSRHLSKLFDKCTNEQKREVLSILDGELWHVDEVIEFVLEDQK